MERTATTWHTAKQQHRVTVTTTVFATQEKVIQAAQATVRKAVLMFLTAITIITATHGKHLRIVQMIVMDHHLPLAETIHVNLAKTALTARTIAADILLLVLGQQAHAIIQPVQMDVIGITRDVRLGAQVAPLQHAETMFAIAEKIAAGAQQIAVTLTTLLLRARMQEEHGMAPHV
jgi:hypothetical protein